jgi:serine/threonine-protein kinase mTOR
VQSDDDGAQVIQQIKQISEYASYSAWNLGNWEHFQKYVKLLDPTKNSYEKNFYQAILDIKHQRYVDAQKHIEKAREVLDPKITSLLGESYNRAYLLVQEMQNLRELEEIIELNTTAQYDTLRRRHLSLLWSKRLEY